MNKPLNAWNSATVWPQPKQQLINSDLTMTNDEVVERLHQVNLLIAAEKDLQKPARSRLVHDKLVHDNMSITKMRAE